MQFSPYYTNYFKHKLKDFFFSLCRTSLEWKDILLESLSGHHTIGLLTIWRFVRITSRSWKQGFNRIREEPFVFLLSCFYIFSNIRLLSAFEICQKSKKSFVWEVRNNSNPYCIIPKYCFIGVISWGQSQLNSNM